MKKSEKSKKAIHVMAMTMPMLHDEVYSRIQDLSDALTAMPVLHEKFWSSINSVVYVQFHERSWKYIPIPENSNLKSEWTKFNINMYFDFKK